MVLFFDLSVSFDSLDVGLFLTKLKLLGSGDNVLIMIRFYMTDRMQNVEFRGSNPKQKISKLAAHSKKKKP